jgi:hypothetical protein
MGSDFYRRWDLNLEPVKIGRTDPSTTLENRPGEGQYNVVTYTVRWRQCNFKLEQGTENNTTGNCSVLNWKKC